MTTDTKSDSESICAQCREAAAKFYSRYGNENTLFCSSECHKIFNDKNIDSFNPLLIELEENSTDGKEIETEVNDVFRACHRGEENLKKLQSQFQLNGEHPNQVNGKGQTQLTYAIANGDVKTLDLLLFSGAEIDSQDDNGDTALMVAAQLESEIKVEFLLEKGALTDITDNEGKTALHRTEQNKTTKCAKLLIDKNPSLVHTKDKHQQTVLHLVAGEGNEELIRYLLERGSKSNELDNLGRTPLHWAVIQGMKVGVELLLENEGENAIDIRDKLGFYPIHCAVQVNRPDVARLLVHKDCNLGLVDFAGRTAFVYAASNGYQEICEILLTQVELDSTDGNGFTALHFAASRGDSALCRLLLDQGASADSTNGKRQTPLHLATANDHRDVVELLTNNGSRGVAKKDEDDRTPIHHAAEYNYLGVLKILVEHIPSEQDKEKTENESKDSTNESEHVLDTRDSDNHTSLYLAASREHKECCEVLLGRGATVDDESRPYLIEMGLVEEAKEEVREEPNEVEVEVEAKEDGGAMSARERYAPSLSPPSEEPPIELAPVTDKGMVANTSRYIQDDVMSARSNSSSRKSNKPDSWSRFMETKKRNKENMMQATRAIPELTGSPYLVPQVDSHIFRRYLIGHRSAHDIYSKQRQANHRKVYGTDNHQRKYSYSRSATSDKPIWDGYF